MRFVLGWGAHAFSILKISEWFRSMEDCICTEPSHPASPAYGELLDVMARTTIRLDLLWWREKQEDVRGRLDERFLSDHNRLSPMSLLFFPEHHAEVKLWKKPYSTHIYPFQHSNYANVEGLLEWGYVRMPPVEETLASYLSQGESSSLKAPALPSKRYKPLH